MSISKQKLEQARIDEEEIAMLARMLNEEGEDEDSDEDADDAEEAEEDTDDDSGDDASAEPSGDGDSAADPHVPFANLDLESAICFGWCPLSKGERSWFRLADQSITKGWKQTDVQGIGDDLMKNVDACYFFIAQGEFVDLDSNMKYCARFNNDMMLWEMQIKDSPDAEIIPEEAANFFKSEFFKKFAMRCAELVDRGRKCYDKIIEPHMQNGEFLQVSEVKLSRILHDANTAKFMDNLRGCKYRLK